MNTAGPSRNQMHKSLNAEAQRTQRDADKNRLCESPRSLRLCVREFGDTAKTFMDSTTNRHEWYGRKPDFGYVPGFHDLMSRSELATTSKVSVFISVH